MSRKYVAFVVILLALTVSVANATDVSPIQSTSISGSGWQVGIPGITVKHSERVPTGDLSITWPSATFDGPSGSLIKLPKGEAFHEFDTTTLRVDLSGYYAEEGAKFDGKRLPYNCVPLNTTNGGQVLLGWDGHAKDHLKILGVFGNIGISDDIIPIRILVKVIRQNVDGPLGMYTLAFQLAQRRFPHVDPLLHRAYAKAAVLSAFTWLALKDLSSPEFLQATMEDQERDWRQQEEARQTATQPTPTPPPVVAPAPATATPESAAALDPTVAPKPDPWAGVLQELKDFDSPNGFLFVAVDAQQMPAADEFALVLWVRQEGKWVVAKNQQGQPEQLRMLRGRCTWKFESADKYEQAGWQGFGFSSSASDAPSHAPIRFGEKPRIIAITKEAGTYEIEGR